MKRAIIIDPNLRCYRAIGKRKLRFGPGKTRQCTSSKTEDLCLSVDIRRSAYISTFRLLDWKWGPQNWPTRSLDIKHVDLFVWKYIKDLIHERHVDTREDLLRRKVHVITRNSN